STPHSDASFRARPRRPRLRRTRAKARLVARRGRCYRSPGVGSSLRNQGALLRRSPAFRSLFVATLASGAGTWFAFVALQLDIQRRTGSGAWIAALLIAEFLPAVVIGLVLGPLLDRLARRELM